VGLELSVIAAVIAAFVPFVLAALWVSPESRTRLLGLLPLGLLVLLAGVSLAWSPERALGTEKLVLWIITGLLPAASVLVLAASSGRVSWGLIVLAAFVSSGGLILFGTPAAEYPGQPTLFEENPIWAARAAFIGALIALLGPFPLLVRAVGVGVMVAAGLVTQSLGPAVGFGVGAVAGLAELLRTAPAGDRRVPVGWALLVLGAGAALLLGISGAVEGLFAPAVQDPNVTARAGYLEVGLPMLLEAPILGLGLGGFAMTGLDEYPHNLPLEVALELGLVGAVIMGAWILVGLRAAAGSPILVALIAATATFSLFSGSLASNVELWMFTALAVGLWPALARRRPEAPP
jgi:O-antigen ligase